MSQEFSENVQAAKTAINSKLDDLKQQRDEGKISEKEYEDQLRNWQSLSVGLSMLAGGLSAPTDSVGGIIAATAAPAVSYQIGQYFKDHGSEGSTAHIMAHAVLAAAVAAAGGNDALTAAVAAGGAEAAAPLVSKWLYGKESKDLTAEEKATVTAIAQLAGTAVGAASGDSASTVAAGQAAQNAVQNNYLTDEQLDLWYIQKKKCMSSGNRESCIYIDNHWKKVNVDQQKELDMLCRIPNSGCDEKIRELNNKFGTLETGDKLDKLLRIDVFPDSTLLVIGSNNKAKSITGRYKAAASNANGNGYEAFAERLGLHFMIELILACLMISQQILCMLPIEIVLIYYLQNTILLTIY